MVTAKPAYLIEHKQLFRTVLNTQEKFFKKFKYYFLI